MSIIKKLCLNVCIHRGKGRARAIWIVVCMFVDDKVVIDNLECTCSQVMHALHASISFLHIH